MDTAQIEKLKALALAADRVAQDMGQWLSLYEIADGITIDALAEFIEALTPAAVLELIDAIPESGSVPVPTTVDMARMMLALGHSYLKEHAPDQLAAPAAEAEKDAERYRWLRDEARSVDWSRLFRLGTTSAYSFICRQSPKQMDRDIDAAIGAHTKAGGIPNAHQA